MSLENKNEQHNIPYSLQETEDIAFIQNTKENLCSFFKLLPESWKTEAVCLAAVKSDFRCMGYMAPDRLANILTLLVQEKVDIRTVASDNSHDRKFDQTLLNLFVMLQSKPII